MTLKKLKLFGVNIYTATLIGLLFLFFSEIIQSQVNQIYSVEISSNVIKVNFEPIIHATVDDLQSKAIEISLICGSENKIKISNSRIKPNSISFHLTLKKNYIYSDCLNFIDQVTNDYYNEEINSELLSLLNTINKITYEDLQTVIGIEKYNQSLNSIKKINDLSAKKLFFSITEFEQIYPNRILLNYLSFFVGFLLLFFCRALKN